MVEVDYTKLRLSEKTHLVWALFWRAVLLLIAARGLAWVLDLIVGGLAGVTIGLAHQSVESYGTLLGISGKIISILVQVIALIVWVRLSLRAHAGRVRLALLEV